MAETKSCVREIQETSSKPQCSILYFLYPEQSQVLGNGLSGPSRIQLAWPSGMAVPGTRVTRVWLAVTAIWRNNLFHVNWCFPFMLWTLPPRQVQGMGAGDAAGSIRRNTQSVLQIISAGPNLMHLVKWSLFTSCYLLNLLPRHNCCKTVCNCYTPRFIHYRVFENSTRFGFTMKEHCWGTESCRISLSWRCLFLLSAFMIYFS